MTETREFLISLTDKLTRVCESTLRRGVLDQGDLLEIDDATKLCFLVLADSNRRHPDRRPITPDDQPRLVAARAEVRRRLTSRTQRGGDHHD